MNVNKYEGVKWVLPDPYDNLRQHETNVLLFNTLVGQVMCLHTFVKDWEISIIRDKNSNGNGSYDVPTKTIYLRKWDYATVSHEIFHAMDFLLGKMVFPNHAVV
jgi:hypothetical protein